MIDPLTKAEALELYNGLLRFQEDGGCMRTDYFSENNFP